MRNAIQPCLAANNILQMRKETVLFSFLGSLLRENGRSLASQGYSIKNKLSVRLNDKTNYYWTRLLQNIVIFLRLRQIIDLLATDKSWYFAQPCAIIVNYWAVVIIFYSQNKWLRIIQNCVNKELLHCFSLHCQGGMKGLLLKS